MKHDLSISICVFVRTEAGQARSALGQRGQLARQADGQAWAQAWAKPCSLRGSDMRGMLDVRHVAERMSKAQKDGTAL